MKKLLAIFLVISILLTFVSCGGNETENNTDNNDNVLNDVNSNQQDTEKNDVADNKQDLPEELTADYVKNHPVTDASLFEVEQVEGGVMVGPYIGNDEIVVIPETIDGYPVVAVKRRAFLSNNTVRAVKLADSIKVIGEEAFLGCENIEVFICGKNLETIDEYAISLCASLKYLELNEGLKKIGQFAISKGSMEELFIPSSVTEIHSSFGDDGLKIVCEPGSYAETHAIQNNRIYEIR